MTLHVSPEEISARFGDYIEEFQAILTTNGIKYGSPDNFSSFARRLYSDDLLSADLDRMVRSIILREDGNISLRTVLTIIAIATGGNAVAEPHRDLSQPQQLVINALVNSGGYGPSDPILLDVDLYQSTQIVPQPGAEPTDPPELPPHLINDATEFTQSLTRLEHNTLEAKQYLQSIEQRISHMEPFFEALPRSNTSASSPNPPIPNRFTILVQDSIGRFVLLFSGSVEHFTRFLSDQKSNVRNYSFTFFSDTFTHKLNDIQKQFDVSLTTFTDNFFSYSFTDTLRTYSFTEKLSSYRFTDKLRNYPYTEKLRRHPYTDKLLKHPYAQKLLNYRLNNQFVQRAAAIPLSVAAIVGGALVYLTIEHKHQSAVEPPAAPIAETATIAPLLPTPPATDHPQLTVYADPLDTFPDKLSAVKPHKPSPDVAQPDHPQRAIQPAANSATSSATATVTTPAPIPASSSGDETPNSTQALSHNAKYSLTSFTSRLRTSPSHAIDVSPGIMASNLVSATPPTYPRMANLIHMQGKVTMQAIIAKNGTVESLQVLQGHRLLRGAAKNAVQSWRYRPYLIDDKPVEVATIVTVDFNRQH
jgi:TonB family protein